MEQTVALVQHECLDVLTKTGQKTGISRPRNDVHRDGDYHRAVHVWIYTESTQQLLLQRRVDCGKWDISAAGHVSAGDSSLKTARRELQEELGVILPNDAFELLFVFLQESIYGKHINNEFDDVYLVTTVDPIPLEALTLQETEVSAVRYISCEEYISLLVDEHPDYIPWDVNGQYGQLFEIIKKRYGENNVARSLNLQKQLCRYAPVSLSAEVLTGLSDGDREALSLLVKTAGVVDEIFYLQVSCSNPALRDWLKEHAEKSELDKLKWMFYSINKSPWSCLDENKAFLTTADSAIKLLPEATKAVSGWKGLEYKTAFPMVKQPGANFYPPDMDKMEFESWINTLTENEKQYATGFFSVIKRPNELGGDSCLSNNMFVGLSHLMNGQGLLSIPYSKEYNSLITKAAELLHEAGDVASSPSLKRLLHSKADAFLSNDYYDSDIAWMELDSKLDVTIGPFKTCEDALFGYKATFQAFISVRDDQATTQLKVFSDNLQVLAENLPMDNVYKSTDIYAATFRVIQLICNAGDVKGPQTVALNLPKDERRVEEQGRSIVMFKNVLEAKFEHILMPIADVCVSKEQKEVIDFESFFVHTVCHECCHGIGPRIITLPDGKMSTVEKELKDLHPALEVAKADMVGLWALKFLINKDLIPKSLVRSMYVSFLADCIRSVRFGLEEAYCKGRALLFNWLVEKEAFVLHSDKTISVNFTKVEGEVESLCRKILTIQAKADKEAASQLLQNYCKMTDTLQLVRKKLENQVPLDIAPTFPIATEILG